MGGGYYDLNIVVQRKNANHMNVLIDTLKMAYNLGYDTVAVNTVLESDALQGKKGKPSEIPSPLDIKPSAVVDEKDSKRKFKILQRITVIVSDAAQTHKLQTSQEIKEYDILAVQPENDKALHVCCSSLDVDIITFPIGSRLPVFLKHQQVGLALERGIFFEIFYGPALSDANVRRYTIGNAKNIIATCKRKNVFVSSCAEKPMGIRGPYDVISFCQLFGLKSAQARDVVTTYGRGVVLKAECRKSGKGVFGVVATSDLPEEDQWKVEKCDNAASDLILKAPDSPNAVKAEKCDNAVSDLIRKAPDSPNLPKSKKRRRK